LRLSNTIHAAERSGLLAKADVATAARHKTHPTCQAAEGRQPGKFVTVISGEHTLP
jgi:hypothetical protein